MKYLLFAIFTLMISGCFKMAQDGALIRANQYSREGQCDLALEKIKDVFRYKKITAEKKAEVIFLEAHCYNELNRIGESIAALKYINDNFPESKYAYKAKELIPSLEIKRSTDEFELLQDKIGKLIGTNNFNEALSLSIKALEYTQINFGEKHPKTAEAAYGLALIREYFKEYNKAEMLYKRAIKIRKDVHGDMHPKVAISLEGLGILYLQKNDYMDSIPPFKESLRIYNTVHGEDSSDSLRVRMYLERVYRSEDKT